MAANQNEPAAIHEQHKGRPPNSKMTPKPRTHGKRPRSIQEQLDILSSTFVNANLLGEGFGGYSGEKVGACEAGRPCGTRDIMTAICFHLLRNLLRMSKAQHHAVSKLVEDIESNGRSMGELKVED